MFRYAVLSTQLIVTATSLLAGELDNRRLIGSMGKAERVLEGRKEVVLFEHTGKGCMTHFWMGGNFEGVEDTRIRYYVDGEEVASIDMDLYMGHGIGFNDNYAPWATKYAGKVGNRNGIYNNYRIPFGTSVKITAQRPEDYEGAPAVWWIVRGVENGRVRLGGVELPEEARLKLHRVEGQIVEPLDEFDLFDVDGAGAVFNVAIAAQGLEYDHLSFLEACIRAYTGDSREPVMLSSGLEDYFLGTYYFDTGRFYADIAGLTHMDREAQSFSAYRFHDDDPIFFKSGLRVTCRNGETQHGTPKGPVAFTMPPRTRYTTYAWVYQW